MALKKVNYTEKVQKIKEQDSERRKFIINLENEIDMKIKLIQIRKEQNLTQKDIAQKSGLTQQMISRIETTNSPTPNLDTFIKYINALGLNLELNQAKLNKLV